jgi:hypothetical protein
MGFNAARGYPGQGDRRHGAARPVERKLGPSRATVGARLKMTFTSHLGPAGAGVQQQHEQRGVAAGLEGVPAQARNSRLRPSSATMGTGLSGTIGRFIRAIGSAGISSSSANQAYRILRTL